jgi:hypothetical protein
MKRVAMAGNTRKTGKEQYYTLPNVVDDCVKIAMKYHKGEKILEPAGGTGEFIEGLLRHGVEKDIIESSDIEPKHDLVKHGDFLESNYDDNYFTISNPPFGRANSLSVKFFNKAADFSTYICFLIPISWRKWSIINRLDSRFHLVEDVEMPLVSFYNDDGPIEGGILRTVFQVWEKRDVKREKITVEDREYLKKSDPENADVALTFFGHSSGKVETNFLRVPNTTKRYFTVKNDEVIQAMKEVDYSRFNQNSAYVAALSLPEVNTLLNEWFDKKVGKDP